MTQQKRKVIIVGGGLSGLTSGIYLLDNGYDVHVYEKHSIPGGQCTGWTRQGQYIDGCAHWIVGTHPKSSLHPVLKHIGAIEDSTKIYNTESLTVFFFDDGTSFDFTCNLTELREKFLKISPEDKRQINSFVRTIVDYSHIRVPVIKPVERMNIFELSAFGLKMSQVAFPYAKYRKMSVGEYAQKFKSERIREILVRFMGPEYNMHSFFYCLGAFCSYNAGIPEGGSLKMAMNVAKKFKSLGGTLHLSSPVSKVRMEKKIAKGIELEDGEFVPADYVIVATDTFHSFNKLLPDVEMPKFFRERYEKKDDYLLKSAFLLSFKTTKDMSNLPRMCDFNIPEIDLAGAKFNSFCVRNYAFDKTLSRSGKTLLTVLLITPEITFDNLKKMSKEEYRAFKDNMAKTFSSYIKEKLGIKDEELTFLDAVTPLTYERYTNAHKGAYMSFVTTKRSKGLMTSALIKGYHNLLLAGQWLMPPGGIPIALMIGKHAAINLCHLDHVIFKNKEKIRIHGVPKVSLA
ncbi:MAG: FAD-dependent oxidoreductase [Bacilli bacterium]|nr:FAD-dependent oxidoreductase [Bacilli bacterium]